MITKFVTVYPGHVDLGDMGQDATPANERRYSNDQRVSGSTDMTYDAAVRRDMIWKVWRMRPGSIVVPGLDLPMMLDGDRPQYLGKREAAITSWYGDDLETTTLFELTRSAANATTQGVRLQA